MAYLGSSVVEGMPLLIGRDPSTVPIEQLNTLATRLRRGRDSPWSSGGAAIRARSGQPGRLLRYPGGQPPGRFPIAIQRNHQIAFCVRPLVRTSKDVNRAELSGDNRAWLAETHSAR
jgi:hypothetical protein